MAWEREQSGIDTTVALCPPMALTVRTDPEMERALTLLPVTEGPPGKRSSSGQSWTATSVGAMRPSGREFGSHAGPLGR